jgi:N12 class adenine-specific DNA methylase
METVASYKEYIYKQAALKENIKLYPHQQRVVDNPSNSIIVAHDVGSGKTLTGIAKFEKMKAEGKANKALVIVPAGLRDNFGKSGVEKFTDSKYNIIGNKGEQSKGSYNAPNPDADYNIIS